MIALVANGRIAYRLPAMIRVALLTPVLLAAIMPAGAHVGGMTAYADIAVAEHTVRIRISLPVAGLPAALQPEGLSAGKVNAAESAGATATPPAPAPSVAARSTAASSRATPAPDVTPSAATAQPSGNASTPAAASATPESAASHEAAASGPRTAALLRAVRDGLALADMGRACTANARIGALDQSAHTVAVVVDYDCANPIRRLAVRDGLFESLGNDHLCLAKVESSRGMQQFAFSKDNRTLDLVLDQSAVAPSGALSFLGLGVEHILTGWDHLLFLLALMLCGGNLWSLFKIVTAFTLAHSITLALAALDIVVLPSRLVESAIAASIAYVAAENLYLGGSASRRWMVSFVFGLVHGFGFSAALRELDLERAGLVLSLLNFNLGVELGQALVVTATVPILLWIRRRAWERRFVRAVSAITLLVGLALLVDRAFF